MFSHLQSQPSQESQAPRPLPDNQFLASQIEDLPVTKQTTTIIHVAAKKKKRKAGKFKSLKKGRVSSESEAMHDETSVDTMSIDDNAPSPELMSDESPHHGSNKRKKMTPRNSLFQIIMLIIWHIIIVLQDEATK